MEQNEQIDKTAKKEELKAKLKGLREDNRLKRELVKNTKAVMKENKLKMRQMKAELLTI